MFKILPRPEPIDGTYAPLSGNEEGPVYVWVPDEETVAIDAIVQATLDVRLPDVTDLLYGDTPPRTAHLFHLPPTHPWWVLSLYEWLK